MLYREKQYNIPLIIAGIALTGFFGVIAARQVVFGISEGNHPAPNAALIAIFVICFLLLLLFCTLTLTTGISTDTIAIKFGAFGNERIFRKEDIESLVVRKYNGGKEFGGWGNRSNGKQDCLTIMGSNGLEIQLKNGSSLLVGTQKPEKLREAVSEFLNQQK